MSITPQEGVGFRLQRQMHALVTAILLGMARLNAAALSECYARKASRMGLVLGFGGSDEKQIGRAVDKLGGVLHGLARAGR